MRTDGLQREAINISMNKEVVIRTVAELTADICDADSDSLYDRLLRTTSKTATRHH
jgi:hypothetical protein